MISPKEEAGKTKKVIPVEALQKENRKKKLLNPPDFEETCKV